MPPDTNPDTDPDEPVKRILQCKHERESKVTSSLSRVWCPECEEMVECKFKPIRETPDET